MEAVQTPEKRRRWWQRSELRALTRETVPVVLLGGSEAQPVSVRSALAVADCYACIRAIVDAVAMLPLHVYRHARDGSRERIVGGLEALLWAPAPAVTQISFLGSLTSSLVCWGDAFVLVYRDEAGGVAQLGIAHPERVSVRIVGGLAFYDVTAADGTRQTVTPQDVVHIRSPLPAPDNIRGLSPIAAAGEALGLARSLSEEALALAQNSGRPSGILRVRGERDAEALDDVARAWSGRHAGPKNSGRVAVIAAEQVEFAGISMPAADMQLLESRQWSSAEVARLFRVPPSIVNAPSNDSLTYSTTEGEAIAFLTFCLRPWLTAIEQALTASVLCPQDCYAEFTTAALLSVDAKSRAEVYASGIQAGWLDADEARERENLPRREVASAA